MRLFVAVRPPPSILDAVEELDRPAGADVRWSTRDQWHVTVRFLGELDEAELPVLTGAVDAAASELAPMAATLGPKLRALGRDVAVVPVSGLKPLAEAVEAATGSRGRPPNRRRFQGHVTVGRLRRGRWPAGLLGKPITGEWTVESVEVVRSYLHPDGARHETVHVAPLTGR